MINTPAIAVSFSDKFGQKYWMVGGLFV